MNRRNFFTALAALVAGPSVVKARPIAQGEMWAEITTLKEFTASPAWRTDFAASATKTLHGVGLLHTGMPAAQSGGVKVYLNGEDVTETRVVAADDRQGWLVRQWFDERPGSRGLHLHPKHQDMLIHELVVGDVQIKMPTLDGVPQ